MSLQQKRNDNAIALRVMELLEDEQAVAEGDYIQVSLPPTFTMAARDEWCPPTSERVEQRHIEQAKRMLITPSDKWISEGLV